MKHVVEATGVPHPEIAALLAKRFDLRRHVAPFQRCIRCNGETRPVAKADILDQLQPKTRRYYDEFWRCEACGQMYWRGSHVSRMQAVNDRVFGQGDVA